MPDCLTIKDSLIDGLGVFATKDIEATNTYVFLGITHKVYEWDIDRVNFGGFINHSKSSNCKLLCISDEGDCKIYSIYPIVDIKAGQEITLNYNEELCGLTDYTEEEWLK
jgi:SET domain-containing protein